MAVVALVGGLGAPGVTTTAMALLMGWPLAQGHRVVLAEADPDGGAILPGALQGTLDNTHGLRNLAVAARQQQLAEAFWRQLVDVTDAETRDRLVLPGLYDPAHASAMEPVWRPLAALFAGIEEHGHDVLVDLGRRGAVGASAILAQRADVVLMVVRNTMRGLQGAEVRLKALREQLGGSAEIGILLVDEGPYPKEEVRKHLEVPVVAVMPWRPKEARVFSDGAEQPRRFEVGELMRSARSAALRVRELVEIRRSRLAPPPPEPPSGRVVSGAR
ncbi:MinD/ParA family ATP-binding protein [Streptomyces sp. CA-243310]|uniref:MinD/ParA family ATP-binding protein n=1 Tax=Streptomyces sp. CA-243310 TaxID=3240056 RepID=UPI003D93A7B1